MSTDPCKLIRDAIRGLEAEVVGLQAELQTAPPGMKPALIKMIREARLQIGDLRDQLRTCEQNNPQPPPSENVVLTTETCRVCTADQERTWQHVALAQLGVDGVDVDGHWIGGFPAERFGPLNYNNWYPLGVEKRVLCGVLHHFNFYDGIGAEADWNNFVIPNPAFRHLLEDAKTIPDDLDEWHDCGGTNNCMEAEITPDESYYENVFNSKASDSSALEGQVICTYGPWVREKVHNHRPEIHPSEMYWWRGQLPNGQFAYTLMMVQDDSNRFDRENNFDFGAPWDDPPSGWRPWSENPRTNRFRIAFELNPAAAPLTFRISRLESLRVHERWGDATPGAEHALEYNGRVVLRVEELLPNEGHLGVMFGSICRNAANNRLQGYIVLTATVGTGDRGGEGYQTLRVVAGRRPFIRPEVVGEWPVLVSQEEPQVPVIVRAVAQPQTLRRIVVDGRAQLAGDVEVQVTPAAGFSEQDLDLSISGAALVSGGRRRAVRHRRISPPAVRREHRAMLDEVAITDRARLEVAVGSGETVEVALPELGMAPRIVQERPQRATAAPGAWSALAAAAGARTAVDRPAVRVARVQSWDVQAVAEYASFRAGRPSAEDDSPFIEALNGIVHGGDSARIKELFGASRPMHTAWTFDAVNLTTGSRVPVQEEAGASPREVRVVTRAGTGFKPGIVVSFPQENLDDVIEVTATARMRDPFGIVGEVKHRMWSHVLTHTNAGELARTMEATAASLAGIASADLVAAADLSGPVIDGIDDDPRVPDLRTSRATMVRLMALAASEDQRITVDELRGLVAGATAFGATA